MVAGPRLARVPFARWGVFVVAVAVVACTSGNGDDGAGDRSSSPSSPSASSTVPVDRPRGGRVRVGVWGEPDVAAPTLGGAAVRALVLPQLFVAGPDGRWSPSLVEPGTDRLASDRRSARFRLRRGAVWSDGSAIDADDLRGSADGRFVAGVDGPAADGTVTVRFTQPLPGWQRLWSGVDSVTAPGEDVWGGPFVVASYTPGLEVVLRRNERWYGGLGPFLDEVRLVLVPDYRTGLQLLERAELDVLAPLATTIRTEDLREMAGVTVDVARRSGWWVGLFLDAKRLDGDRRKAVVATVDREPFVGTLLRGEADVLDGFGGRDDRTWDGVGAGDAGALKGRTVGLVGELEEPNTYLLQRSMQKRARAAGGQLELRNAEADRVEGWLARGEYDAAVAVAYDGPSVCWLCRWGGLDEGLARAADGGDRGAVERLEQRLRDDALLLPLWRPRAVVGARPRVGGVRANGYGLSPAWNAWEWYLTD